MALIESRREKALAGTKQRLKHLKTDILSSRMSELILQKPKKAISAAKNAAINMGNSVGVVVTGNNFEIRLQAQNVEPPEDPNPKHDVEIINLGDSSDDDPAILRSMHRTKRRRLEADLNEKSADVHVSDSRRSIPSSSEVKFEQAPFYKDAFYDVVMYRGPGYDMFPVVLGTVDGHKEFCKQWESARERTVIYDADSNSESVQYYMRDEKGESLPKVSLHEDEVVITEKESDILAGIMVILPNIQRKYALEQIGKYFASHGTENADLDDQLVVERVVEQILSESSTYPQAEATKKERIVEEMAVEDPTGHTIIWDKKNKKDHEYISTAVLFLGNEFERVPYNFIRTTVKNKLSLFDSYLIIYQAETDYSEIGASNPYTRLKSHKFILDRRHLKNATKTRDDVQYAQMVNEFQAAKQHVTREAIRQSDEQEKQDAELLNFAIHEANGEMVECQCCFDSDTPFNRSVVCEGADVHFFCFGCVIRLAENQIGIMKHQMQCMDGSGCKASLSHSGVFRAVPEKLLQRLALNEQQASLREADIEGLERCELCDFMAICPPIDLDSEFNCQNPDCGKTTCRKCKKPSHLPRKCNEDAHLDARHRVEEARSEATMRTCPKCKVKIVKEAGCNKMPCTNCQTVMCYVCRQNITAEKEGGYGHFRKKNATCPLFDQTDMDRHATEANDAERKAIEEVRNKDSKLDAKLLAIETVQEIRTLPAVNIVRPAVGIPAIPPPPFVIPALPRLPPPRNPIAPLAPLAAAARHYLAGRHLQR